MKPEKERPPSRKLVEAFTAKLAESVPKMNADEMRYWIKKPDLKSDLGLLFDDSLRNVDDKKVALMINVQKRFFRECFGLKIDCSNIRIPARRSGYEWLLVVPRCIDLDMVSSACQRYFFVIDIHKLISIPDIGKFCDDRSTNDTTYAVWVRDECEVDIETRGMSAFDSEKKGLNGITLLEYLLLACWCCWKSHIHLDTERMTICAGTKYVKNYTTYVPVVSRRNDCVVIEKCIMNSAMENQRVRTVVC